MTNLGLHRTNLTVLGSAEATSHIMHIYAVPDRCDLVECSILVQPALLYGSCAHRHYD